MTVYDMKTLKVAIKHRFRIRVQRNFSHFQSLLVSTHEDCICFHRNVAPQLNNFLSFIVKILKLFDKRQFESPGHQSLQINSVL